MPTVGQSPVSDPNSPEALLKLLSDTKALEARLKELRDAQRLADEKSRAAVQAQSRVEASLKESERLFREAQALKKGADESLKDMGDRQSRLRAAEEATRKKETELSRRENAVQSGEEALARAKATFEKAFAARTEELARALGRASARQEEYEKKLAKLAEAMK